MTPETPDGRLHATATVTDTHRASIAGARPRALDLPTRPARRGPASEEARARPIWMEPSSDTPPAGHDRTDTDPPEPSKAVGARLRIGREDISWRTVVQGIVKIEFRVHNDGDTASEPEVAKVRSAQFGAHLDWTPLCDVEVPSIPAGGSHLLSTLAQFPRSWNSGDEVFAYDPTLDRVQLDSRSRSRLPWLVEHSRTDLREFSRQHDLRGGHWIGNIDVHVAGAYAEKHCARGVLARAGCCNKALLLIGPLESEGRVQDYEVHAVITRSDPATRDSAVTSNWDWCLYREHRTTENEAALYISDREDPVYADSHHPEFQLEGATWCTLLFTPPEYEVDGRFELHVKRKSTGKTAVVEFDLTVVRKDDKAPPVPRARKWKLGRAMRRLRQSKGLGDSGSGRACAGPVRRAVSYLRRVLTGASS